jgi:putative hydrolase of the HAD superfamily
VPVAAVVFDLGGVLAEVAGVATMRELAGIGSDDELWRRWLGCPWVRRFELGQCTAEEFGAGMVDEWQLPMTGAEFVDLFSDWVQRPSDGADELVADAAAHVPVALLSNMNAVHWERSVGSWPLIDRFDHVFTSFQLGLIKPDVEVFAHVAEALALEPARILFLDDNAINVAGAQAAGFQAQRVRGVAEARTAVERALGLSRSSAARPECA